MFKVVTTDGTTVSAGPKGDGFSEKNAQGDADRRNRSAEGLGLKVRYEVAPIRDEGDFPEAA